MIKAILKPDTEVRKMKPLHGVGQPPFYALDFSMFRYLTEAGIPYSRLHDVQEPYGAMRYVDIPNVFPNFDADETDPASYHFEFTDILITKLMQAGVEPFYRLGVTIENECAVRMFRLAPPADFGKWARICEHIIRHYTQGWAKGFHYDIQYWEIWNEPENNPTIPENEMWWGTKEEYYALYDVTAKHLKQCFPNIRIGGYSGCGFLSVVEKGHTMTDLSRTRYQYCLEFFNGFMEYIKTHNSPLDYFSWHSYGSIQETIDSCAYVRRRLDEAGYSHVEHICNEWNYDIENRGTVRHAAYTAGWMLAMQDTSLNKAMFYDARFDVCIYGSLFSAETTKPYPAYYTFRMFNELFTRTTQREVWLDTDTETYAVAAGDADNIYLMISSLTDAEQALTIDIGEYAPVRVNLITETGEELLPSIPDTLRAYGVLGIELAKKQA